MRGAHNILSAAHGLAPVLCLALAAPVHAEPGGTDLLSAETLTATADIRMTAVDGEPSWTDGGFGKTRYGNGDSGLAVKPRLAEADLVWQPRFTWSLSGTVVGTVQGDSRLEPGLSEAYLSWKPLTDGAVRLSARAGLMWPPVSLEHSGPEWAVTESITPSAINSWIGEEVKVVGAEFSAAAQFGGGRIALIGALFDMNDTSGTLLAFRGWALHDRKAMIFRAQPLPPLNAMIANVQPRASHPVLEVDGGYMKHPGFYAKIAWDPPIPVHVEYLHYDNASIPDLRRRVYGMGLADEIRQCRHDRESPARHAIAHAGHERAHPDGLYDGRHPLGRYALPLGLRAAHALFRPGIGLGPHRDVPHAQRRELAHERGRRGRLVGPCWRPGASWEAMSPHWPSCCMSRAARMHSSARGWRRTSRRRRFREACASAVRLRITAPLPSFAIPTSMRSLAPGMAAALALIFSCAAHAGTLSVRVTGSDGKPIADRRDRAESGQRPGARAAHPGRLPGPATGHAVPPVRVGRAVGATVSFPNLDPFRHHVYSFSPAKRFELKLYAKDQTRSVTFDKAGIVAIGCNIHDSMSAFIFVTDTVWTARTDATDWRSSATCRRRQCSSRSGTPISARRAVSRPKSCRPARPTAARR